jgi:hypothetical protein
VYPRDKYEMIIEWAVSDAKFYIIVKRLVGKLLGLIEKVN